MEFNELFRAEYVNTDQIDCDMSVFVYLSL